MTHAEMVTGYRNGRTYGEISEDAGVTRQRVQQIVSRYISAEERARIQEDRRVAALVTWECRECHAVLTTRARAVSDYCSRLCQRRARERAFEDDPAAFAWLNPSDGHLWVKTPDGRSIRCERAIAEIMVGRRLHSTEWVTLRDRDPLNLDPENIEIATPAEITRRSREAEEAA
jgi:hypothetical protein